MCNSIDPPFSSRENSDSVGLSFHIQFSYQNNKIIFGDEEFELKKIFIKKFIYLSKIKKMNESLNGFYIYQLENEPLMQCMIQMQARR